MENIYIRLYNKYSKKLLNFNNTLFNGGRSKYYNKYMKAGYEYSRDGSYSTENENDKALFNKYILEYCGGEGEGERCTYYNDGNNIEELEYSKNANSQLMRSIKKKLNNVNNEEKEWLVNHWIYADNFYKINIIIMLLDDLYRNSDQKDDIANVANDFLLYNTCSGLLPNGRRRVGENFRNLALSLREDKIVGLYIKKLLQSTDNAAENLCDTEKYDNTDYGKKYNGGLNDNHSILYKYYSKR